MTQFVEFVSNSLFGCERHNSSEEKRSDLILMLCLKCPSINFSLNILWRHFQVIKCVKIMSGNINKGIVYDHYNLFERGKSQFSFLKDFLPFSFI